VQDTSTLSAHLSFVNRGLSWIRGRPAAQRKEQK
jgi:hypothetical protein